MPKPFTILLLSFLLESTIGNGQKSFIDGYIITKQQDTIHGTIKDRSNGYNTRLYKKIRFRSAMSPFTKRLSPYEIKGYCKETVCFESHWVERRQNFLKTEFVNTPGSGKKVFLKVIVKGKLTLYHWEFVDDMSDTPDFVELFKRANDDYFVRASQGVLGLKKKLLSNYLQDRPDIVEKINNGDIKTAREIAEAYNAK